MGNDLRRGAEGKVVYDGEVAEGDRCERKWEIFRGAQREGVGYERGEGEGYGSIG